MPARTKTCPSATRPTRSKTTAETRSPSGVPAPIWEIHHPLSDSDRALLRLVSEQRAVRLDQLTHFLGRRPSDLKRTIARLERGNYLTQGHFLVNDEPWVWIETTTGVWAADTGFKRYEPQLGSLLHTAAVNDIRLQMQRRHPKAEWICERALMRAERYGAPIPDAVLVLPRGQRYALEVELTRKCLGTLAEVIAERCKRYDRVIYYCSRRTLEQLRRFRAQYPKLVVRALPGAER
jgi:hypothetical protein